MRFRKLRIAWSVVWGLACVLLIVLWVRSYWRGDYLQKPYTGAGLFFVQSASGHIEVYRGPYAGDPPSGWRYFGQQGGFTGVIPRPPFAPALHVNLPHWLLVVLS